MNSSAREEPVLMARSLLQALPEPAFLKRADGRYIDCNEAWSDITGLPRKDLLARRDDELFDPEVSGPIRGHDQEFWNREEITFERESLPFRPDAPFEAVTQRSPIYGRNGRILGLLAICRQIGQRERGVTAPASGAASRPLPLERAIPAGEKAADSCEVASRDLLGSLMEELHLPLNSVLGFANLLTDTELTFEQNEHVDGITSATRGILGTLGSIHELAQISAGNLQIREARFNFRDLLRDVVQQYLTLVMEKRLTISYRVDESVPEFISGDRAQIRKLMSAYLSNAAKFTAEGTLSIGVQSLGSHRDSDGSQRLRLRLQVSDSGRGIPRGEVERVFQPFFKGSNSDDVKTAGAGVGLAVARAYASAMGGRAWIESTPGVGTNALAEFEVGTGRPSPQPGESGFQIHSATIEEIQKPKASPESAPSGPQASASPGGPRSLRIIMAEDMPSSQKLSRHLFERMGHELTVVNDGRELIQALKTMRFDAVFVDIQMPFLDGLEAAQRIRNGDAGEANRDIFISAVTACVTDEVKNQCSQAGMDWFLDKPLLTQKLRDVLSHIHARA